MKAALLLAVACSGPQRTAVVAAEKQCLDTARASLQAKLASGCPDLKQCVVALTESELVCAFEALAK